VLLSAGSLTVRNVSGSYLLGEEALGRAPLVHSEQIEQLFHRKALDGTAAGTAGTGGGTLRVSDGLVLISQSDATSSSLLFLSSSLTYAPPQPSIWPSIAMGVAAVVITLLYQYYRRSKRATPEAESSNRHGRGGLGGRNAGLGEARHGNVRGLYDDDDGDAADGYGAGMGTGGRGGTQANYSNMHARYGTMHGNMGADYSRMRR